MDKHTRESVKSVIREFLKVRRAKIAHFNADVLMHEGNMGVSHHNTVIIQ